MKCQNLFSGKNKKNISVCCLLKILPRVLSVKASMSKQHIHCIDLIAKICRLMRLHRLHLILSYFLLGDILSLSRCLSYFQSKLRSIVQWIAHLAAGQGAVFKSQLGHITLLEIDDEIISMVSLLLCWFKKGICQYLAKSYAQSTV